MRKPWVGWNGLVRVHAGPGWPIPGFLEIRFKIRGRGNFGISPKFDQNKGPSAEICPLFMPSGLAYPRIFRNFIQNKGSRRFRDFSEI